MRIALAVEGTRGDVHPMLHLGALLRARGHDVVVCAPPDFREAALEREMAFRAVGPSVRAWLNARADAVAAGGIRALREASRWIAASIEAQFEALPNATADADRIVGAGIQIAGPSVAESHGVPYRYVAYCPALFPSREHAPLMLAPWSMPRWANRLGWCALLPVLDRLVRRQLNRHREALGLSPLRAVYPHLLSDRPVLAADPELAPCPTDCRFEVEQIPCLHPWDGPPLPAKLESFLSQGPAPVYLGFGSMTDPDPGRTTRHMLEAVTSLGCRALVSAGWAGLGAGALPEGVLAIGPVTHAALFPRLAAVVHHGGAGTTTTAARAGVPQIVVPHVADQFYWARRVTLLGLGPPSISRRRFSSQRLAGTLAETIGNEALAERAREFGARLRARAHLPSPPI